MPFGVNIRRGLIVSGLVAAALVGCGASGAPDSFTPVVSMLWTPTPASTQTKQVGLASHTIDARSMTLTPIPSPTPQSYTIVAGDTLWDIAVRYGLTLDELVAANASVEADRLKPGQVINIPVAGSMDAAQIVHQRLLEATAIAEQQGSPGMVAATAGGLRLREGPDAASQVLAKLEALTPLTILRRSDDGSWLEVALRDGNRGWVMSAYIDTAPGSTGSSIDINLKADIGEALSTDSLQGNVTYLTGFNTHAREIFTAGQSLGNRANVFAVVGDSNSASSLYLEPFDTGNYTLGTFGYLEDTIKFFKGSFRFTTVAAVVGFDTLRMMDPAHADPTRCLPAETPLACEYRRKRPAVALILLGTNDTGNWQKFEANFRPIVEYTISKGIVPILMTKGDDLEHTRYNGPSGAINTVIAKLSREYGVPLLDLNSVAAKLPANGFGTDGYHFNVPPDAQTANFTGTHMNYGYTLRNLTSLQALDAVRRLIIGN